MSSVNGGRDAGGANEDVEADETSRTEDARALQHTAREDEDVSEPDSVVVQAQGLSHGDVQFSDDGLGLGDNASLEELVEEQDYAQLSRGDSASDGPQSDGNPSIIGLDAGLGSPIYSGSIPDDLPSFRGSLASSPARDASPIPRRTPTRSASGALQPFERRFETRLNASPSPSPRATSPAFLGAHSRQISSTSQFSHPSSQEGDLSDESPQAPWDVIRWTPLRKITAQAFSESGRRSFGRPTCLAVSALIAVGTSKGLILGFDYHQTLKIIIGQGTTAAECGSVTALAISADYSTIVAGHANGHIFTWEISRPARPFLRIPPLDRSVLADAQHPDGHMLGSAVLHVGFLGTRHTAVVSADAGGMAFSHLATRGLGPVTRTMKTARLLGRYPSLSATSERPRKPSSVLAFAPLPLGNVEQATDGMGLTAMLTPYLLVIVSTTPIPQTQHKSARPKGVRPHSTLSGCLAWFPAVKLKHPGPQAARGTSETKLVYCWSNILSIMEIKTIPNADPNKQPDLEFQVRGQWRAEEAITAVQWLGRSVLGVLTISQRFLILEDGALQVTDTIDLLHKHIYHQDLFSRQLQSVVEQLDDEDYALHGVIADAFYMSFKAYKGRTFLLGFDDFCVGTLSNWADRLMALMEAGDHIAALRLATEYYTGSRSNITVGLPDVDSARQPMVRERLVAMISASLQYTFSQQDDGRSSRIKELAAVCFAACVRMDERDYLFGDVFEIFDEADDEATYIETLEPYVLEGEIGSLPPAVIKAAVSYFVSENQAVRLEELLCRLDPQSFDLDQLTILCRQHSLYDALIFAWTRAIGDFVTPLIDLLSLVKILDIEDDVVDNPFYESAMKIYPYLAYTLTGRRYPKGDYMDDADAYRAKADVYGFLFAGKPTAWPTGSDKILQTMQNSADEPAFPYLVLLLEFNAANLLSMLNEAFEDPFLNDSEDETLVDGVPLGEDGRLQHGLKMTRQHIVSILLVVMQQRNLDPEQVAFIHMFIARTLPKYPGQLVLSGSLLDTALQSLCQPPSDLLKDDCQLSVEYLLSAYRPPNMSTVIERLRNARFYRVLKSVYRGEKMYKELLETYFEDTDEKDNVFEAIEFSLRSAMSTPKQSNVVKSTIQSHVNDLASISAVAMAQTLALRAPDILESTLGALQNPHDQFVFLRTLFGTGAASSATGERGDRLLPLPAPSIFNERYVQLMCRYDPKRVAAYIESLPSGDLQLDHVLPAMEESGVVDAAVVLLARDGSARAAMDRLVSHMHNLRNALTDLIDSSSQSPEVALTREAMDDLVDSIDKYTKVGIWLCQGQSRNAQRKPRPRTNPTWEIAEDDLDLDEFLWLNLVDVVVQVSKETTNAVRTIQDDSTRDGLDLSKLELSSHAVAVRNQVQQVFTSLLAATAAPSSNQGSTPHAHGDNLGFLRVLRAFLTRAATSAPSLADLREVLADIFTAYAFEQEVLTLANDLVGSDVFADIQEVNTLRQRGWRPRSQVCEHCKRRAWGQGIGDAVWSEWMQKEHDRGQEASRKIVERSGGDEARKLERGKSKVEAIADPPKDHVVPAAEHRRLELVVFACRHVYHRVCLDTDYKDGRAPGVEVYTCPLCTG